MPPLSSTQKALPTNYTRVDVSPPQTRNVFLPSPSKDGPPTTMRCPTPPVAWTPDSSRQFYRNGAVPQFRTFGMWPLAGAGATQGGTVVNNSIITQNIAGSTTTNNNGPTIQTASVTTPVLNPGTYSFSTITLSKVWTLVGMSVSGASRVRIYANAAAQSSDALRSDKTALNFETTPGVICDVTVDSPPWTWVMTPAPNGANGDAPQTANAYVTVNNDAAVSSSFIVSLQFVKLA